MPTMIAVPMIAFAMPDGCGSPKPVSITGVFVRKSQLSAPPPRLATEAMTITSTATASNAETVASGLDQPVRDPAPSHPLGLEEVRSGLRRRS